MWTGDIFTLSRLSFRAKQRYIFPGRVLSRLRILAKQGMANPKIYLPTSVSETTIHSLLRSLSFPRPTFITLLSTSAAYHIIYSLSYANTSTLTEFLAEPLPPTCSPTTLILRISGLHFPGIKTRNECAVLKWLAIHTHIPVPRVLHYDASCTNALEYEYMLMTMASGQSFDLVRADLSPSDYKEHLDGFVHQVVEIIAELQSHSWHQIGGLQEKLGLGFRDGEGIQSTNVEGQELAISPGKRGFRGGEGAESIIVEGPVVDENMWQVPELDLFWGPGKETFQSLNVTGPFPSYVSFLTAQAEKYVRAIRCHVSLSSMLSLIPRIEAFVAAMEQHQEELNQTRLVLAHRDFHYGNIMYDVSTLQITAVLDWEFAGVVPAQRWDPQRAFLWGGVGNDDEERIGLRERVVKGCRERGITFFDDVEYTGKRQEHMQLAMNFLKAIVEVMPRGQLEKPVETWKEAMLAHMNAVCSG